jgi:CheY-like chemotaxis protein
MHMTWRLDGIDWFSFQEPAIKAAMQFAADGPMPRKFSRRVAVFRRPAWFEASNLPGAGPARIAMAMVARKPEKAEFSHALLVEDSLLIAVDVEQALRALGVHKVSIAATVEEALDILKQDEPQFALLDLGLGAEMSLPVAERLIELEIPFAFATGYGRDIGWGEKYAKIPRLEKPFGKEDLCAFLQSLHKKAVLFSKQR